VSLRAAIRDIRDPNLALPDYLVIDANVFLKLSKKPDVAQFMTRVSQAYRAGQTLPMICIQTLEECYHVLLRNSYSTDRRLDPRRTQISGRKHKNPADVTWHELYKDRPLAIKRYMTTINGFFQQVTQALPIHVIEPEDLAASSSALGTIECYRPHCLKAVWSN
jgi:hypothetical protein